jgi:uncharacterized membrane protein
MDMLILCTAIACAAMGGVFFAFSSFVMRALARMPPAQAVAAMQSINIVAVTPVFMIALFGTAATCVVVGIGAVTDWQGVRSGYLLTGSLSYVIGSIAMTIACNVPLNNALAGLDPKSSDALEFWPAYVRQWTAWNHVRTVAGLLAAALLALAIMRT